MNTGIQINQIILQNHFRMPHRPTMQNWVDFLTGKGGGGGLAREAARCITGHYTLFHFLSFFRPLNACCPTPSVH